MAFQFNIVEFAPMTYTTQNGQTVYQVDSKLLVQGMGAKVKLVPVPSSQGALIYIDTNPMPSSYTSLGSWLQLPDLPTELYLAPGETLYALNASNQTNFVKVIHYLDEAPSQIPPLNLSGSISLTGQV